MSALKNIQQPVAAEIKAFEGKFKEHLSSRVALVDKIMRFIVKRKGKQMRPLLVFLTAKMLGKIEDRTYIGASLVEMMHTATLVHDDVVDDSFQRRGFFSVNALWKNKVAVLIGDYMLSRVLLLAVENKTYDLLEAVSKAVKAMSEGELLQIEKARKLDITEEVYFEVIEQKTASLIQSCCAVGALSAGADQATVEKAAEMGRQLGLAFQIKDDLFDFERAANTGKPQGIDIQEQKMTLPLIAALNAATEAERKRIIVKIKRENKNPKAVAEVLAFVDNHGGVAYAREKMLAHLKAARDILNSFPDNEPRAALDQLFTFTVNRNK